MNNLESLLNQNRKSIIYECVSGSRAYGAAHEGSDEDIRGIYVLPRSDYFSLTSPEEMVADDRGDIVYYTIKRFIQLAANANPNIIELLFMPEDCIKLITPPMQELIQNRKLFLTKQSYESHVGYALAQIKKARGQNKWINNPQPKTPPTREDYCWVILRNSISEDIHPFRPIRLKNSKIDLKQCHVSSLEHCPSLYRLYHIGKNAKGVFKGGSIVCESIAPEEESASCIELLIYNQAGYECSLKDYHNYWD